ASPVVIFLGWDGSVCEEVEGMRILRRMMLLGLLLLSSCTVVDEFSPRAITYNLAAERAQNQALLLNVVRSSLRRPMQFTTVQSVTGTASEGGTVQLTLPFGNHTPLNPNSVQLSGMASGGPSFAGCDLGYAGVLSRYYAADKRT